MKKRNISVEFARLVASFVVILCHCNFFAVYAPESETLHRIMICLLADSVGMFWLITGFFLADEKNYAKMWIRTLKKVLIPGILMMVFTYFLTDPIINGIPLFASEAVTRESISDFFIKLVTFRQTSIYWYVFAYVLVIAVQPLLSYICGWLDKKPMRELLFVLASLGLLAVNDLYGNKLLHLGYTGIFVLVPAAIEVIWGHMIFRHRQFFMKPAMLVIEVVFGIGLLAGRTYLYTMSIQRGTESHLTSWFSSFGFLMATLAVLICMQVVDEKQERGFYDVIRFFSGFTYPIYLIHPILLTFARTKGAFDVMYDWLGVIFSPSVSSVFSVILAFMVFYMISFGIAVVLRKFCRLIKY